MAKKKITKGGVLTTALVLAGAALVLTGTAGQSRAVLNYFSQDYRAEIEVSHIGVTLHERNTPEEAWRAVSARNYVQHDGIGEWEETGEKKLLGNLTAEGEAVLPGKTYREYLTVQNTGSIEQYVRVVLYRYWTGDASGERDADTAKLEPQLIRLGLNTEDWIVDETASTDERVVLYYRYPLRAEEYARPFLENVTIDRNIGLYVYETRQETDEKGRVTYTTESVYDGKDFRLEAEADAVQAASAQAAIRSAWGVDVAVAADGALSL